eukprot:jgi/Chrzof1/1387/Cz10g05220.t1
MQQHNMGHPDGQPTPNFKRPTSASSTAPVVTSPADTPTTLDAVNTPFGSVDYHAAVSYSQLGEYQQVPNAAAQVLWEQQQAGYMRHSNLSSGTSTPYTAANPGPQPQPYLAADMGFSHAYPRLKAIRVAPDGIQVEQVPPQQVLMQPLQQPQHHMPLPHPDMQQYKAQHVNASHNNKPVADDAQQSDSSSPRTAAAPVNPQQPAMPQQDTVYQIQYEPQGRRSTTPPTQHMRISQHVEGNNWQPLQLSANPYPQATATGQPGAHMQAASHGGRTSMLGPTGGSQLWAQQYSGGHAATAAGYGPNPLMLPPGGMHPAHPPSNIASLMQLTQLGNPYAQSVAAWPPGVYQDYQQGMQMHPGMPGGMMPGGQFGPQPVSYMPVAFMPVMPNMAGYGIMPAHGMPGMGMGVAPGVGMQHAYGMQSPYPTAESFDMSRTFSIHTADSVANGPTAATARAPIGAPADDNSLATVDGDVRRADGVVQRGLVLAGTLARHGQHLAQNTVLPVFTYTAHGVSHTVYFVGSGGYHVAAWWLYAHCLAMSTLARAYLAVLFYTMLTARSGTLYGASLCMDTAAVSYLLLKFMSRQTGLMMSAAGKVLAADDFEQLQQLLLLPIAADTHSRSRLTAAAAGGNDSGEVAPESLLQASSKINSQVNALQFDIDTGSPSSIPASRSWQLFSWSGAADNGNHPATAQGPVIPKGDAKAASMARSGSSSLMSFGLWNFSTNSGNSPTAQCGNKAARDITVASGSSGLAADAGVGARAMPSLADSMSHVTGLWVGVWLKLCYMLSKLPLTALQVWLGACKQGAIGSLQLGCSFVRAGFKLMMAVLHTSVRQIAAARLHISQYAIAAMLTGMYNICLAMRTIAYSVVAPLMVVASGSGSIMTALRNSLVGVVPGATAVLHVLALVGSMLGQVMSVGMDCLGSAAIHMRQADPKTFQDTSVLAVLMTVMQQLVVLGGACIQAVSVAVDSQALLLAGWALRNAPAVTQRMVSAYLVFMFDMSRRVIIASGQMVWELFMVWKEHAY